MSCGLESQTCLMTAKPYLNSEDTTEEVATISPIALLVLGIKTCISASAKHTVDFISAALLKVRVNTPIPNTGQHRAIPDV